MQCEVWFEDIHRYSEWYSHLQGSRRTMQHSGWGNSPCPKLCHSQLSGPWSITMRLVPAALTSINAASMANLPMAKSFDPLLRLNWRSASSFDTNLSLCVAASIAKRPWAFMAARLDLKSFTSPSAEGQASTKSTPTRTQSSRFLKHVEASTMLPAHT